MQSRLHQVKRRESAVTLSTSDALVAESREASSVKEGIASCSGRLRGFASSCPVVSIVGAMISVGFSRGWLVAGVALCVLAAAGATVVQDCKTGKNQADEMVKISGCDVPPCRLRKKSDIEVEARFKTDRAISSVHNSVTALILGLQLPFIGVDGVNACSNIYAEDGTKVGCPLAADTSYIYKNSFNVLDIYPKIKTTVTWALTDETEGSRPLCFNVKVRITG